MKFKVYFYYGAERLTAPWEVEGTGVDDVQKRVSDLLKKEDAVAYYDFTAEQGSVRGLMFLRSKDITGFAVLPVDEQPDNSPWFVA